VRVRRVAMFLLAGVSLSAQEPLGPAQNGVNYSLEKEAALGKHLAADFRRRTIPVDSPVVQIYLDRVGQKIAASMPDARFPFTFSVIADEPCRIHEPTALPGGYVFVPVGLFVAAQEEDEFAGMLAHAMEHVAQRHGPRQATRGTTATIPLIFMGGWGCSGELAVPAAFLASQRSAELEADVSAVQTLARAGFDPNALVRYVERVQVQPTGPMSKVYSPIPDRDERITALLAAIQKLPKVDYAVAPTDEFATARHEARRLMEEPVRSKAPPSLMRKKQE
jgi:predicted Zn-dependent protease